MELVPYVVVTSRDVARLAREVNMTIKQGYEPLGGVIVIQDTDKAEYAQAMLRKPAPGAVDIGEIEEAV